MLFRLYPRIGAALCLALLAPLGDAATLASPTTTIGIPAPSATTIGRGIPFISTHTHPAQTVAPSSAPAPAPSKPKWTFPAPKAGNPPAEAWLPRMLSKEDQGRRADDDRALAAGNRINNGWLENVGKLQAELEEKQYDLLESQLDAVLTLSIANPDYEFLEQSAANFADNANVKGQEEDQILIEAWVAAKPRSPWAHYSLGLRWSDTAWEDRGNGWAKDVKDEQWKKVHDDETNARREVRRALALNSKLAIAWVTLMNIDRTDTSDLDKVTADYSEAAKINPRSFMIPNEYEEALQPRWLGSAGMMDDFAQSMQANVDRNPRFWELQGEALADSGCSACNDYHWDVSLKQYNAALGFEDRPSWMVAAGDAALHLRRYALAYAYYDRATHYVVDDIYWNAKRDFTVELCDPSQTPAEVDKYREDMVKYIGIDDIPYPHGTNDCVVYERELPWAREPIADVSSTEVYYVDPDSHFEQRPQGAVLDAKFPGKSNVLKSDDGKLSVVDVDMGTPDHDGDNRKLQIVDTVNGKATDLLVYHGMVNVSWTADAKHLYVSKYAGMSSDCLIFDTTHRDPVVDLVKAFYQQIGKNDPAVKDLDQSINCGGWWNNNVLMFGFNGVNPQTHARLFRFYEYRINNGVISLKH